MFDPAQQLPAQPFLPVRRAFARVVKEAGKARVRPGPELGGEIAREFCDAPRVFLEGLFPPVVAAVRDQIHTRLPNKNSVFRSMLTRYKTGCTIKRIYRARTESFFARPADIVPYFFGFLRRLL